jgi:hypothetical protein
MDGLCARTSSEDRVLPSTFLDLLFKYTLLTEALYNSHKMFLKLKPFYSGLTVPFHCIPLSTARFLIEYITYFIYHMFIFLFH